MNTSNDPRHALYLTNVKEIKPFKNKVVSISKACASDLCFLVIDLGAIRDEKFGNIFDYVNTNYVKNNECYVGMERDRPYTLEELGL